MPHLLRWQSSTQAFIEPLGEGQALTMLRIPAGRFLMGSPDHESERDDDEGPLHEVEIQEFLMAATPITQAQWRAVAGWTERQGESWRSPLPLDPSLFRGERARLSEGEGDTSQRPVERISWEEAMEFCRRLSQRTRRRYTLPSEAQWEYACRAGSTSPYAFGFALTAELATLRLGAGVVDDPRVAEGQQTTPVQGHPSHPANAWGLRDMHGNVWEWCLDHWHSNYLDAPNDGSPWIDANAPATADRVVRGGAWSDPPGDARSACRYRLPPQSREPAIVGLRVVCLPPRLTVDLEEILEVHDGGVVGKGQVVEPMTLFNDKKPLVYISYAWRNRTTADQTLEQLTDLLYPELIVDELCLALAEDCLIVAGRYDKVVHTGGATQDFAGEAATADLLIAVINHEFLRSVFCMIELLQLYRARNFRQKDFGRSVLALVLDDAQADLEDQEDLFFYWFEKQKIMRQQLEKVDPRKRSPYSWKDVDELEEFVRVLPDLLQALRLCVMPRGAEALREVGFHQIRELVMRRLLEKRREVSG
jgi:formylglycine-generating enzyme required for sulfatase activity